MYVTAIMRDGKTYEFDGVDRTRMLEGIVTFQNREWQVECAIADIAEIHIKSPLAALQEAMAV